MNKRDSFENIDLVDLPPADLSQVTGGTSDGQRIIDAVNYGIRTGVFPTDRQPSRGRNRAE